MPQASLMLAVALELTGRIIPTLTAMSLVAITRLPSFLVFTGVGQVYTRLVSSPTPDLPVFVLGILAAAELLAFLEDGRLSRQESAFGFISIVCLCAA